MAKWRFWEDDYWGDGWNDRHEISNPRYEGIEIDDAKVEAALLDYYIPEVRQYVEIDGDDQAVYTKLDWCLACDTPSVECKCDSDSDHYTYISYHATKV